MFCGFNKKMVDGMALYAQGLFEAAVERSREDHCSLQEAFDAEVRELAVFLEAVDREYRVIRRGRSTKDAIRKTVKWAAKSRVSRSAA